MELRKFREWARTGNGTLVLLSLAIVLVHFATNGRYGFHRDELLSYSNARDLEWGYVPYPPVTALLARLELLLFGTSLWGFRFFPAISQGLVVLLTGLMARELGGKREAQFLAAAAAVIQGPALVAGWFFGYTTFDYFCWVLVAYAVCCLLRAENPRWWISIGAAVALGMMTKYSMAFFALGIFGGLLLTPARRYFKSPWFWGGAAVALAIVLPNILWQIRHHLVSLAYLKSIHARDIGMGWTNHFLLNQFWKSSHVVTLPLWCAGLWFVFATPEGQRYKMLGWMYLIPLVVLFAARGRDYYLSPAYPMLFAAGAVWGERWVASLSARRASIVRGSAWKSIAVGGLLTASATLPLAPFNSAWWRVADHINGENFNMQIGWPEMVAEVAKIRDSLPAEDRARLGILAGDEGETGAVNLYGPAFGLPRAISGMNSNWLRGYGDPPPQTVIVLGEHRDFLDRNFESCELAGRVTNPYGIVNLTIAGYDEIFVCSNLRQPWPQFWKRFQYYG
ncbi:MAG TPA: glycosyltransferase family 39 protein [Candidatus Acidoferrales bacterium]|nr:glycosyltransferase family 39 protein [Candidatus Acidoferrales bacterium]